MIRAGGRFFIDTGAWVALAVTLDSHHDSAATTWAALLAQGCRPCTSVPVVIETFTWLQRGLSTRVAMAWKDALEAAPRLEILDCGPDDLAAAWAWLERRDLHKLGLVDATSFVLMKRHKLRAAFAFDVHFATAGFEIVG